MWNEYMEWEDGDDPITFYDEYEYRDRFECESPEDSQYDPGKKVLGYGIALAMIPIGMVGCAIGTAIGNHIKKGQEQNNAKEVANEWERAKKASRTCTR